MSIAAGVELECSYGAGDGWTRSGVASRPRKRSGGSRLDRSSDWGKHGYDKMLDNQVLEFFYCTNKVAVSTVIKHLHIFMPIWGPMCWLNAKLFLDIFDFVLLTANSVLSCCTACHAA